MVITYYGAECFRIQFGNIVLGFNPIGKNASEKNEKPPRFGADIAFVSLAHPLFSATENFLVKDKSPFVIAGPGEYEIQEVFVKGYPSRSFFGNQKDDDGSKMNTIYSAKLEGIHLVFLGALGEQELEKEVREDLGEIDILFVPIGGEGVLLPHDAYSLSVNLSPKMIIPMHYVGLVAQTDALEIFLKEGGKEKVEKKEKLTVKQKDLSGVQNEIVVLESAR